VRLSRVLTIEELRAAARRRLPRAVFDYVDGGAEDETGIARNRAAFERIALHPRYLVDITERSLRRSLFGREWAMPLGIAPTGFANLVRPGADLALAGAARDVGIPFVLSTAGTTSIERVAEAAPEHSWFQLYAPNDWEVGKDLVDRAAKAGMGVLVMTVDVPLAAKRERDLRNGFALPFMPGPGILLDGALHPAWSARFLATGGAPRFETMDAYADPATGRQSLAAQMGARIAGPLTWDLFAKVRDAWTGPLVVKGVMTPHDAAKAVDFGADGIWVSNHGGRQLDAAPAPIDVLPSIAEATAGRAEILLDSGIRRGSDIVKALALGATFAFVGRPTLYAAAAAGRPGIDRALAILRDELDRCLGQIGVPDVGKVGPEVLGPVPSDRKGAG